MGRVMYCGEVYITVMMLLCFCSVVRQSSGEDSDSGANAIANHHSQMFKVKTDLHSRTKVLQLM
jgi:hypothetical protein